MSNVIENLADIIKNTPIQIKSEIKKTSPEILLYVEKKYCGYTTKLPYRKLKLGFLIDKLKLKEYKIELSYSCDNMPKTLVHEALHIVYPKMSEQCILYLEDTVWKESNELRNISRKRIIEELYKKNI